MHERLSNGKAKNDGYCIGKASCGIDAIGRGRERRRETANGIGKADSGVAATGKGLAGRRHAVIRNGKAGQGADVQSWGKARLCTDRQRNGGELFRQAQQGEGAETKCEGLAQKRTE